MSASQVTGFGVQLQPVHVVPPVSPRYTFVSVVPAGQLSVLSTRTPSLKLSGSNTQVATDAHVGSAQSTSKFPLLSTLSKQFSGPTTVPPAPAAPLLPAEPDAPA